MVSRLVIVDTEDVGGRPNPTVAYLKLELTQKFPFSSVLTVSIWKRFVTDRPFKDVATLREKQLNRKPRFALENVGFYHKDQNRVN